MRVAARSGLLCECAELLNRRRRRRRCARDTLTPPHPAPPASEHTKKKTQTQPQLTHKKPKTKQILRVGLDVAVGLAVLHPAVLHGDLKPHNVLLGADGDARLADFGISRFKDPSKTSLSVTHQVVVLLWLLVCASPPRCAALSANNVITQPTTQPTKKHNKKTN